MLKFSLIFIFLFSSFCSSEIFDTCITFSSSSREHSYTMRIIGPDLAVSEYLINSNDFLSICAGDIALASKIDFFVHKNNAVGDKNNKDHRRFSILASDFFLISPEDFRCVISSERDYLALHLQSMSGIIGTKYIYTKV